MELSNPVLGLISTITPVFVTFSFIGLTDHGKYLSLPISLDAANFTIEDIRLVDLHIKTLN